MRQLGPELEKARMELRPLLMGVCNLTPDSFYDGGRHWGEQAARARIDALVRDGADIVDLGAESSKPGALPVPAREQMTRLDAALTRAVEHDVVVSVDTTSSEVAEAVLRRGATLINDVSCLGDHELARVAARHDAWLAITHCRGSMAQMDGFSRWPDDDYPDIVKEVLREWDLSRKAAVQLGVKADQIICDPGLGFAKNARHSFELLRGLRGLRAAGAPILVGPGRKSFIAAVDPSPPRERLGGTIAASLLAAQNGADIVRVHDVFEVRQALRVLAAIRDPHASPRPAPRHERAESA